MTEKNVTLALDLGPTSIGWSLIDERKKKIIAAGVRVFPEGVERDTKGGEVAKNQQRRQARGMRRQVARRARRKLILRKALVSVGLLPPEADRPSDDPKRRDWERSEYQKSDPYELRRRALDERLEHFEIGRILLNLAQRRGFLSNRKADRAKKKEDSDLLNEISQLEQTIQTANHRTLGEHLDVRREGDPGTRVRGLHTRRQMYLDEFEAIWESQRKFYPDLLTDRLKYGVDKKGKDKARPEYPQKPVQTGGGPQRLLERFGIHGLIFFQRPMYWPKSVIGRCELDPKQKRCPRADRAAQEFRIMLEVNNLRIITVEGEIVEPTQEQREIIIGLLNQKEKVTFDDLRKKLNLRDAGFNLEAGERKKLDGHAVDAKMSGKKLFGKEWSKLSNAVKDAIVRSLIHEDERVFRDRARQEWNLVEERIDNLLEAHLPDGFSSYGRQTIESLLPFLRQGLPLTSSDGKPSAMRAAGFLAPWERPVKGGNYLPEPPKITNPIVRQALFEVRKLVNAIVREYGNPAAVHVELARDVKGTAEQRARMTRDMRERERRRANAAEQIREVGDKPTHGKIDKYLLWVEQREVCIYSGRPINLSQLLGGEVDVDHILPYSKSLDNSLMNRVVCFRNENADKGQRTVHEWLAATNPDKYEQVIQRASRLPIEILYGKLPKFSKKTCELEQFINRQLTDTAYITSAVLHFLRHLGCDIVASKGQLTAELRHQWGLNTVLRDDGLNLKSREDHRHHAVDAIVIALTSRARLQQLAHRGDKPLPEPWSNFRSDVENVINTINVSHRALRKVGGALHEETIYGATQKVAEGSKANRPWAKDWTEENGVYVLRKPLESLSLGEVARIRDDRIREVVEKRLAEFGLTAGRKKGDETDKKDGGRKIPKEAWQKPLYVTPRKGEGTPTPIRKVRLLKPEKSIVPIGNKVVKYVKPGNLHHICIFEIVDSNGKSRREAIFVSMLEASRRTRAKESVIKRSHPTDSNARFVMSISCGEMVQGVFKKKERLVRFNTAASTQGQLYFIDHTDARPSASVEKFVAMANTLNGHKVLVDLLGRIHPAND